MGDIFKFYKLELNEDQGSDQVVSYRHNRCLSTIIDTEFIEDIYYVGLNSAGADIEHI